MTSSLNGLHRGGRLRYWTRQCGPRGPELRRARVAGEPVLDPYTSHIWVPVLAEDAPADREPEWIRLDRVVPDAPPPE